jgi:hypothetical protein
MIDDCSAGGSGSVPQEGELKVKFSNWATSSWFCCCWDGFCDDADEAREWAWF